MGPGLSASGARGVSSWLAQELAPKRSCGRLASTGRHDAASSIASVALLRLLSRPDVGGVDGTGRDLWVPDR